MYNVLVFLWHNGNDIKFALCTVRYIWIQFETLPFSTSLGDFVSVCWSVPKPLPWKVFLEWPLFQQENSKRKNQWEIRRQTVKLYNSDSLNKGFSSQITYLVYQYCEINWIMKQCKHAWLCVVPCDIYCYNFELFEHGWTRCCHRAL